MDKKSLILIGLGQLLGWGSIAVGIISDRHSQKEMEKFVDGLFEKNMEKLKNEATEEES